MDASMNGAGQESNGGDQDGAVKNILDLIDTLDDASMSRLLMGIMSRIVEQAADLLDKPDFSGLAGAPNIKFMTLKEFLDDMTGPLDGPGRGDFPEARDENEFPRERPARGNASAEAASDAAAVEELLRSLERPHTRRDGRENMRG